MSPYPRFDRLAEDKRERILSSARAEFVSFGFDDASLNRIIEAAGISKGSFYYYFEDKSDLMLTTCERYLPLDVMDALDVFDEATDSDSFWSEIGRLSKISITTLNDEEGAFELTKALVAFVKSNPEHPGVQGFWERGSRYVMNILETGQRLGAIRTDFDHPTMLALWMSTDQILSDWALASWSDQTPQEHEHVIDVCVDTFRRLFTP